MHILFYILFKILYCDYFYATIYHILQYIVFHILYQILFFCVLYVSDPPLPFQLVSF